MYFVETAAMPAILFSPKIKVATRKTRKTRYIQLSGYIFGNLDGSIMFLFKIGVYRIAGVRRCCYFADLWSYF